MPRARDKDKNPGSEHPVEGKCGAHLVNGRFCTRPPCQGQRRCHLHGGKTPAALAVAAERVLLTDANDLLVSRGIDPATLSDPIGAIERLILATIDLAGQYRERLQQLIDTDDLTVTTISQGEQLRAEALAAERWMKEARQAMADYVRLELDVRRVRLDEAKVRLQLAEVVSAFESVLADPAVGLSAVQAGLIRQLTAEWFDAQ